MLKYILLCVLAGTAYWALVMYPVKHGSGETAPKAPKLELIRSFEPIEFQDYSFLAFKKFKGEVRVLHKKRYLFDAKKDIAPIDLLVGWGEMSDERNIDFIQFNLNHRDVTLNYIHPPIPEDEISKQMILFHLVTESDSVTKKIRRLRIGNNIELEGLYIRQQSTPSIIWNSESNNNYPNTIEKSILWVTKLEVF